MTMNGWLNYVLFINDVSAAGRIQIKDWRSQNSIVRANSHLTFLWDQLIWTENEEKP
jgi:hypothetical protein